MFDRPPAILSIFLGAWLVVAGCSPPGDEATTAPLEEARPRALFPPSAWEDHPTELRFAGHLSAADVHSALTELTLENPEHAALLTMGWNGPETVDGKAVAWSRKGSGIVEIPLVRPGPLTLSIHLAPPPQPTVKSEQEERLNWHENYEVRLRWNQHDLKTVRLPEEGLVISLSVPVEVQRYGLNLFEVQPSHWIIDGERSIGVRCSDIRLSYEHPEIDPGAPPVSVNGDSILQRPGTVISEYFILPGEPILKGSGALRFESGSAAAHLEGEVSLTLTHTDGRQDTVFKRTLKEFVKSPEFTIEHDLSSFDGEMAGFTLSYSARAPEGTDVDASLLPSLAWTNLALSGTTAEPAGPELEEVRGPYNVFVILFDTLRADHIEPYGATDTKTPNMTALARQGVTFLDSHVNQPWTRGSVATMLTGTYPWVHGVLHNNSSLPPDLPYLPEMLRAKGYKTMHILHNSTISSDFGFVRGYDAFHRAWGDPVESDLRALKSPEERADYTWDNFVRPFLSEDADDPFFIYLHEIDPHGPYTPESPYDAMYDTGYAGHIDLTPTLMWLARHNRINLSYAEKEYLRSRYRGEISFMDDYLGRLLEHMNNDGLRDDTLLLFLSDHGEEFLEHGSLNHRNSLYEELLRVPMIFSLPGVLPSGQKTFTPIEMVDITPTLLDLLGFDPAAEMQGRSMLPVLAGGGAPPIHRPTFAHKGSSHEGKGESSVHYRQWKLYKKTVDMYFDDHYQYELFNLEKDPGESVNLGSERSIEGKTLRQLLRHRLNVDVQAGGGSSSTVDETQLDADTIENLNALGYLM